MMADENDIQETPAAETPAAVRVNAANVATRKRRVQN